MEGKKKQLKPERQPLKTLNHISWKEKLKESCYRRVKEDRSRLLWNSRSPLLQSSDQKDFIHSAVKDIFSDELKKLKNQRSDASELPSSLSGEDDILWEYDGPHTADKSECEEILLEMQRIFYEDIELELSQKEAEKSIVLEDEEDEYLALALDQYMQLNDGKVNLSLLKDRLAEALEEHLDRGCRLKPEFCIETVFDLTALYIQCQHCNTFEVVM
uniref:RPA-interacting protein n=1 Tax=Chenopodium quinoa TaxID=63459 RepID=A0A803L858_CHEQI